MNVDRSAEDIHHATISGEFSQNYRFLSELIGCRQKNATASQELADLVKQSFCGIRERLNRRQIKILNQFVRHENRDEDNAIEPPVPEELEAAIRVKRRATWLPWEAEAIRKIERWRADVELIVGLWTQNVSVRAVRNNKPVDWSQFPG